MPRVISVLSVIAILGACKGTTLGDARAKFNETKERAYVAVMKTDLRALADSLGAYHARHGQYVVGTASNSDGNVTSGFPADFKFAPIFNVTVRVDTSGGGWSATASHATTPKVCVISPGVEPTCK
jgi:type II secretory pathway pseudopilin PulG